MGSRREERRSEDRRERRGLTSWLPWMSPGQPHGWAAGQCPGLALSPPEDWFPLGTSGRGQDGWPSREGQKRISFLSC